VPSQRDIFFAKEYCNNLPLEFSGSFMEEIFGRLEALVLVRYAFVEILVTTHSGGA
jgi:hypothetical protein